MLFKVCVRGGGGKNNGEVWHDHIVEAKSEKVLIQRLKDAEIINGRESVHIEILKKEGKK